VIKNVVLRETTVVRNDLDINVCVCKNNIDGRKMSDEIGGDVADDDDFFDQPYNRRDTSKKAVAERRSSLSPDHVHASRPNRRRNRRNSSSDESSSDHSSEGKRRASVEKESCDRGVRSSSAKQAVVIPLPSDSHQDESQASDDTETAEEKSPELREPVQKEPPRVKKKNKKLSGGPKATVGLKNKNRGSVSSCSKSDEEKSHLKATHYSRRPVSSTISSQQLGAYKISRAVSAPLWRPQQSRPGTGFSNSSRMDVKILLESLLHAENSHPRRKSVADPIEFRRRRNYTFGDERLETIERENKRLLGKIVKIHYSEPVHSWAHQKRTTPVKPTTFPDVARIKQLEKIEKENLVWQE